MKHWITNAMIQQFAQNEFSSIIEAMVKLNAMIVDNTLYINLLFGFMIGLL